MKKISGLFFLVLLLFSACKKEPVVPDSEPEPETVLAIGVWQNGNYFFSLNSEGFLTSYIAPDFIDCGMVYNATNNEIICNNTYFVRNTSYKIKEIDSKKMDLEVNYKNVMGEELTQEIILYKSNKIPVSKDNPMVGKSFGGQSSYFGTVTYNFQTFQTALKSASQGTAANYPLSLFYIFFENHVYFQTFNVISLSPTIGAWNVYSGDGEITVCSVEFGANGNVESFINVTDSML